VCVCVCTYTKYNAIMFSKMIYENFGEIKFGELMYNCSPVLQDK